MAKYTEIVDTFILKNSLRFWYHIVRNFNEYLSDEDFFRIVRNNTRYEKVVELIRTTYSDPELRIILRCDNVDNYFEGKKDIRETLKVLWNGSLGKNLCISLLKSVKDYILARIPKRKTKDITKNRFLKIKEVLELNDVEYDIFLLLYLISQTELEWPTQAYMRSNRDKPFIIAMGTDRSYAEIARAVTPSGKLRKFNLIDDDLDFNYATIGAFLDGIDDTPITYTFYRENKSAEILPWSFFGRLAETEGEILKRILASKPHKCNILLYGVPGTGKTSFARALAREAGRHAWEINQGESDGSNMNSESRIMGIHICNSQESPDKSLLIIDEADEILRCSASSSTRREHLTEKGVVNTILDDMKIPAIWISNNEACEIDESVRRRFDYSICFEDLTCEQRTFIWRNVAEKFGLGDLISTEQIERFAGEYETNAGGISIVLENVKRLNPDAAAIDELIDTFMKPHCKLLGIRGPNRFTPSKGYSLEGLNIKGKIAPEKIVKAVRNFTDASFNEGAEDRPRMNILMFGPPGTGKTEFVKYLGKTLGRKVMVVKGSDILDKYVGESEKNIVSVFRCAEAEHAILFFDEIDGILQSRENAHASWEVSQVNEILQQMENFNGIMIAATNFYQNLDPAVMRRFTFKLEFNHLDDNGKKTFFEKFFNSVLSEEEFEELKALKNLSPGDFRTVRQELFYLGEEVSNTDRISALKEECACKKGIDNEIPKVGFTA